MIKFVKYIFLNSYHRPSAKLLHFYVFIKKLLFNHRTNIFSEKMLLLKEPPSSVIYYNFFGRFVLMLSNIISILILNKFADNNVNIENSENGKELANLKSNTVWPKQPIHMLKTKA